MLDLRVYVADEEAEEGAEAAGEWVALYVFLGDFVALIDGPDGGGSVAHQIVPWWRSECRAEVGRRG